MMTGRHRNHKVLMALAAVAVAGGLGACGLKSVPQQPEGATYPRQYPAPEGKSAEGEPAAEKKLPLRISQPAVIPMGGPGVAGSEDRNRV